MRSHEVLGDNSRGRMRGVKDDVNIYEMQHVGLTIIRILRVAKSLKVYELH